jgi:hypothetical protein
MADGDEERPEPPEPHPLVAALRQKPSGAADSPVVLTGLFGDGDEDGRYRVYFSPQLDHYAEFAWDDVLRSDPVSAEPMGLPGDQKMTRVTLKRGAKVDFTHIRRSSVTADNQFDLDVRLAGEGGGGAAPMVASYGCVATLFCGSTSVRTMCVEEPRPTFAWCVPTDYCARTMHTRGCPTLTTA